jgi:hypothetical protein
MFRPRASLLSTACAVALTALAAVACTDKQPTQPKAATAAAQPVAVAAAPARAANGSTVCLAYMSRRADVKVRLDKAVEKARALANKKVAEPEADMKTRVELKRRVERYEALMSDACR